VTTTACDSALTFRTSPGAAGGGPPTTAIAEFAEGVTLNVSAPAPPVTVVPLGALRCAPSTLAVFPAAMPSAIVSAILSPVSIRADRVRLLTERTVAVPAALMPVRPPAVPTVRPPELPERNAKSVAVALPATVTTPCAAPVRSTEEPVTARLATVIVLPAA
jgi:hypothetical protein